MKKHIKLVEITLLSVLAILTTYGIFMGKSNYDRFFDLVQEDGLAEYLTAIFLFLASVVCLFRIVEYRNLKKSLWVFTAAVLAFLFFFAAGEEISWGQRIFNIQSGDFFMSQNKQGETNLHNLIVGDVSVNKLIFSQLVNIVLVIYFLFSRLLAQKVQFIGKLIAKFNVPLPQNQHIIFMLVANALMGIFSVTKMDELHELSFGIIFFLIFLNPFKHIQD